MRDCIAISCVALLLSSCSGPPDSPPSQLVGQAEKIDAKSRLLQNMPMNDDKRCMGIALTVEALLEATLTPELAAETPKELGQRIYHSVRGDSAVRCGTDVVIEGRPMPVWSPEALQAISTAVADLYKRDYLATAGPAGDSQVESQVVASLQELDDLISQDGDGVVMLGGVGLRWFADGSTAETVHAFLVSKADSGGYAVHDPNDPGSWIATRVIENDDAVEMEWKAQYRDTGKLTRQRYVLTDARSYLQSLADQTDTDE